MLRCTLATTALALLLLALVRADDAPKAQDKNLEGEWEVKAVFRGGQEQDSKVGAVVTFQGNHASFKLGDMLQKMTFKVDASKTPKMIDLTGVEPPDKDTPMLGVYEVKGDELRLCLANDEKGQARPKEVASKDGDHYTLMVMSRIKK